MWQLGFESEIFAGGQFNSHAETTLSFETYICNILMKTPCPAINFSAVFTWLNTTMSIN